MEDAILLVQATPNSRSRTFCNYESVDACILGICNIYEEHLKDTNLDMPQITYELDQLYEYIDKLHVLKCMVYQNSAKCYTPPLTREWVKEKIYALFEKESKNFKNAK